jgi:hypothetical protein
MISETGEKMIRCMVELKFADPKQKKTKIEGDLLFVFLAAFEFHVALVRSVKYESNIADFLEN